MRLKTLRLRNFRCFVDEEIDLSSYTAVVGPNNSGKSTLLKAVDLFFRSGQRSSPIVGSDFNDHRSPLTIALVFTDLPPQAAEEFKHYCRHELLEFFIRAELVGGVVRSSVHGRRSGIPKFAAFFEAKTAAEKKAVYSDLQIANFPDLPKLLARSSVEVHRAALMEYEERHPELHDGIDSEDLAFGAAGIAAKLRKHVEWVYIPAVKDAADEDRENRNSAFAVLVNRIVRSQVEIEHKVAKIRATAHDQIRALVTDYKSHVRALEKQLDREFRQLTSNEAHVRLDWTDTDADSIGIELPLVMSKLSDDLFEGDVSLFGHGLQRNYLLALVHLNAKLSAEVQPSIIIAIEEPELYQHPPQARYLQRALQQMSVDDQVLLTTHSPYFISVRTFENIRVVRKQSGKPPRVSSWTVDEQRKLIASAMDQEPIGRDATIAKLEQYLQPEFNEAFFCGKLVLVEGAEDKSLLLTQMEILDVTENFFRHGGHVVSVNGKGGLVQMLAMARGFETPCFVMFDADTACKPDQVEDNKRLNGIIAVLAGLSKEDCKWPDADQFVDRAAIWKDTIQGAMVVDHPQWFEEVRASCADLKWDYDKLKKNPTVLATT